MIFLHIFALIASRDTLVPTLMVLKVGFLFECDHCNRSKTVSNLFHDLKKVKVDKESLKIGQILPILATFYEFKSRFE
jgi:hypothetical protein